MSEKGIPAIRRGAATTPAKLDYFVPRIIQPHIDGRGERATVSFTVTPAGDYHVRWATPSGKSVESISADCTEALRSVVRQLEERR